MMIITSAGALSQWPIGYLSDRIDRRVILVGVSFMASGLSLFFVFANFMPLTLFLIFTGLFSVACLPMYSLTVAHTNDFLQPLPEATCMPLCLQALINALTSPSSSLVTRIGVPAAILETYEPFSGSALDGQNGTG